MTWIFVIAAALCCAAIYSAAHMAQRQKLRVQAHITSLKELEANITRHIARQPALYVPPQAQKLVAQMILQVQQKVLALVPEDGMTLKRQQRATQWHQGKLALCQGEISENEAGIQQQLTKLQQSCKAIVDILNSGNIQIESAPTLIQLLQYGQFHCCAHLEQLRSKSALQLNKQKLGLHHLRLAGSWLGKIPEAVRPTEYQEVQQQLQELQASSKPEKKTGGNQLDQATENLLSEDESWKKKTF